MLTNEKISIMADVVIDDNKIATFGAIMNVETGNMSIYERRHDEAACKEHRNIVRQDKAAFEDFAYSVQDNVKKAVNA